MKNIQTKNDISIEIIRILACYIVICLHTSSWYITGETVLKTELGIKCFLQDAVPIFLLITGSFLFTGKKPFVKILKKVIFSILLPAFFVMVYSQIAAPWLTGKETLLHCITSPQFDLKNLFGNIFRWSAGMTLCGHLWYVFSYLKVILWYPLISVICRPDVYNKKIRYYILAISAVAKFITDVQQLYSIPLGNIVPFSIIDNSLWYVLLGYEIYQHKDFLIKNKVWCSIIGFYTFLLANVIRFQLSLSLFDIDLKNDYFLHIESFNNAFSSIGLFVFLICVLNSNYVQKITQRGKVSYLIRFLSTKTFWIYLLHRGIYEKMGTLGLRNRIYSFSNKHFPSEVISMLSYAMLIFLISLLVAAILEKLFELIKKNVFNRFRVESFIAH